MTIFWSVFLAIVCAMWLPWILGLLYVARKIILCVFVLFVGAVGAFQIHQKWQDQQYYAREAAQKAAKVAAKKKETIDAYRNLTAKYETFMAKNGVFSPLDSETVDDVQDAYRHLGYPEKAKDVERAFWEAMNARDASKTLAEIFGKP